MDKTFDRLYLYNQYLREQEQYLGKFKETQDEQEQWALNQWHKKNHYDWLDIVADEEIIGFLVIGFDRDGKVYACHPECDYWIAQAYVLTEYRNNGYMTSRLTKYVNRHPGDYGMYIPVGNPSKSFWLKRFSEMGYQQNCNLRDIENMNMNKYELLGFNNQRRRNND